MKRFLSVFLAIVFMVSFVGCDDIGSEYDSEYDVKDYLAPDKTFEFEGLKITLTEAFRVDEQSDESVWYESYGETSVAIDVFDFIGTDVSLDEFVSAIIKEYTHTGGFENISEVKAEDDFLYFDYDCEMFGFEFKYMEAFYMSNGCLWTVYFMCDIEDYDTLHEYFIKWAKSVVIP